MLHPRYQVNPESMLCAVMHINVGWYRVRVPCMEECMRASARPSPYSVLKPMIDSCHPWLDRFFDEVELEAASMRSMVEEALGDRLVEELFPPRKPW